MNKKTDIAVIISIVGIVAVALIWFFFFSEQNGHEGGSVPDESQALSISVDTYYDADMHPIRTDKPLAIVNGVSGVSYVSLKITATNKDTIPLDFIIVRANPKEFSDNLPVKKIQSQPGKNAVFITTPLDIRGYAGSTKSFNITIRAEGTGRASIEKTVKADMTIGEDPSANFEVVFQPVNLDIPTPEPVSISGMDIFGIKQVYQTKAGSTGWDSRSWNNTHSRVLKSGSYDTYDLTNISRSRGNGQMSIDGKGIMALSGTEPRMYLNALPGQAWKDVELTMYYQRVTDSDTDWAGMVFGARSGAEGHTTSTPCLATTYYGKLRNDGRLNFEKELEHPDSSYRSVGNVWNNTPDLPYNQWIGMKYVVYNTPSGVQLKLYRDLTGGKNGGVWELLGETTDTGGWSPAHNNCTYDASVVNAQDVITGGGGVVFIRNTNVQEARYKWVSVREIIPPAIS